MMVMPTAMSLARSNRPLFFVVVVVVFLLSSILLATDFPCCVVFGFSFVRAVVE